MNRKRLFGWIVCLGLLGLTACDKGKGSEEARVPGGEGQSFPLEFDGETTYPGLCAYTVVNEGGETAVQADFSWDGARLKEVTIENRTGGQVDEVYRYRVDSWEPRRIEMTRFVQVGSGGEERKDGRSIIVAESDTNVAELKESQGDGELQTTFLAVYSQHPVELIATGPTFPIGQKKQEKNWSLDQKGRLRVAEIDQDEDGSPEGTVEVEYAGNLVDAIYLSKEGSRARYMEASYDGARLELLKIDPNMDGEIEELVETSFDCEK